VRGADDDVRDAGDTGDIDRGDVGRSSSRRELAVLVRAPAARGSPSAMRAQPNDELISISTTSVSPATAVDGADGDRRGRGRQALVPGKVAPARHPAVDADHARPVAARGDLPGGGKTGDLRRRRSRGVVSVAWPAS